MTILAIFVAMLLDSVRWLVCGLAGWFIKKLPIAIGVGVTVMLGASLALKIGGGEIVMVANAAASTLIVCIFHILRNKLKSKAKSTAITGKGKQ